MKYKDGISDIRVESGLFLSTTNIYFLNAVLGIWINLFGMRIRILIEHSYFL